MIKVNYEKDKFEHLILEFVCDITTEAQRNCIGITGQWHQLFCDEIEEPNNFSLNSVIIRITRN